MPADSAPPVGVLAAFGVAGVPMALHGGQRTVWRVGETVFKPLDSSPAAIEWQAEILGNVDGHVRIAPPRATADGRWVVDGWTAWRYEPGTRRPAAWADIAAAGRLLHRSLVGVPAPPWLGTREDRWARADRIAWGEDPPGELGQLPLLARMLEHRRPLDPVAAGSQLIHSDLTGNVLFASGLPPVVLDFSPAWRPAAYASAIVAVDAMLWEGASSRVVDTIAAAESPPARASFGQHVLRALMFRLIAAQLARSDVTESALESEFGTVTAAVVKRRP